jgi:hypothetical protein
MLYLQLYFIATVERELHTRFRARDSIFFFFVDRSVYKALYYMSTVNVVTFFYYYV